MQGMRKARCPANELCEQRLAARCATHTNSQHVSSIAGPCGGKSTAQAALKEFFTNLGWRVYCVPEAATVLLGYALCLQTPAVTFEIYQSIVHIY
jgi:hypothetical protein